MQMTFSVTLEQMYNGAEMVTEIERRIVCRGCKGKKAKGKEKCKSCGRCPNEVRMVQRQMGPGFMVQQHAHAPSLSNGRTLLVFERLPAEARCLLARGRVCAARRGAEHKRTQAARAPDAAPPLRIRRRAGRRR